jgi:acetyltransferase-like isoleucine patch superfamily enzyme
MTGAGLLDQKTRPIAVDQARGVFWKALRRPGDAVRVALALLKGSWYKTWYPLRGRRFRAGRNFRVHGSLRIRGPGQVLIGNNVRLLGRVTPWTYAREARIAVGDDTWMDGVRMGCAQAITIGRECIIADARIFDTDFHSTHVDRRRNAEAPIRIAPVVIEDNVWVGAEVGLLPGTWIGRNSVVGYGSVCVRRYPENTILFGNPAKVVAPVPGTGSASPGSDENQA